MTGFDPAKVAGAYNSGGLYHNDSEKNRWRLRNYPLGHSVYVDHFVAVFNRSVSYLKQQRNRPPESFAALLHGAPRAVARVRIPKSWTDRSVNGNRAVRRHVASWVADRLDGYVKKAQSMPGFEAIGIKKPLSWMID
jgi:hypothetical protein